MYSKASGTDNIAAETTFNLSNGGTLYDYTTNVIRKNYASTFCCAVAIDADGTRSIESIVGSQSDETVSSTSARKYITVGRNDDQCIVGLKIGAVADIPTGTVVEIWGVRKNA